MATESSSYLRVMNRLAKWRSILAGWQLGTRLKGDPESDAVRDHREQSLLMRAEITALTSILLKKKICTPDELTDAMVEEAEALSAAYAKKFPGLEATDDGISVVLPEGAETMRRYNFKP